MNSKISEIRDRIAQFKAEDHYEPNDIIELLNLLDELASEMGRIEMRLQRYIELGPAAAMMKEI